jgi:hypothetical protein
LALHLEASTSTPQALGSFKISSLEASKERKSLGLLRRLQRQSDELAAISFKGLQHAGGGLFGAFKYG